jgi:glycosyltransferase involved in cell wall biosynthesis
MGKNLKPKIEFWCPFAVHSGYAQAAHDTAMALIAGGVDLSIIPIHDCQTENLEPRYAGLADYVNRFEPNEITHRIVMTIPRFAHEFVVRDLEPPKGVKKIVYSTWETDKLDPKDAKSLDEHFDAVIWPSEFSRQGAARGGVPGAKQHVIPYGFDPKFWWMENPPIPDDVPYTFYCIGLWNERKNPIGLLKAYLSEFRDTDHVRLVFVAQDVIDDDINHLGRCIGIPNPAPVTFIRQHLNEIDHRELHHRCHCYVTVARGEAWALGAFEAAVVGNPVLSVRFGGQMDFLKDHAPIAAFIPYNLTPAITPEVKAAEGYEIGGIRITPMKRAIPTGINGDQHWAEPDLYQTKLAMRVAYNERWKRSNANRDVLERNFSYRAVGAKWLRFLEGA